SPLGTTYWNYPGDLTARRVGYAIGVMSKRELEQPEDPAERILRFFYGRVATNLNYMGLIGDRMPGITGEEAIRSLFGRPPPGMTFHPTKRRYPFVAYRFPKTFITIPKKLERMCVDTDAWWREKIAQIPSLDLPNVKATFAESIPRFQWGMDTHVT